MENIETQNKKEKALLIGVDCGFYDAETSIEELAELADTAGAEVMATVLQKRSAPSSATYIGTGRLEEIKQFCNANEIDLIIADDELTPTQARNIEDETDVRVIDRTNLILDIFAKRAKSSEGKIQVELAQLKYSLPRLAGKGTALSRLGGGIGTRGPGETKLESDKRHIRKRIQNLTAELAEMEKRRKLMHERRRKNGALSIAIVGYTNAGKSTLMNLLTNAGVLEEDKLFATLDPTARKLNLPNGQSVMLVDTVGLIRRLPHHLVEAFKSTLEEAVYADLILNVCDASSEDCYEHIEVTNNLITSLGCGTTPMITVLNKCDLVNENELVFMGKTVKISAKYAMGINELLNEIVNKLPKTKKREKLLVPFKDASLLAKIRNDGMVFSEEYTQDGILADVLADISLLDKFKNYIQ